MTFTISPPCKKTIQALLVVAAGVLPTAVLAKEVTLQSPDGTVNIIGEYVDYVEDYYIIRTGLGDLRISSSRVNCLGAVCPDLDKDAVDLTIAGSETVGVGLMPLLMSGYAAFLNAEAIWDTSEDGAQVTANLVGDDGFGDDIGRYAVSSSSSSEAFQALLDKSADIGMASRRIKPAEARALKADGAGNMVSPSQEFIVAVDSLVLIANPSNPVDALSIDQLRGIYTGEITNWAELGGQDQPILMVGRQDGSGTRSVFENRLFGEERGQLTTTAQIAEDNQTVAELVNTNPGALGYVGYAFQRGAKPLSLVNECGIATTPDAFSAKTEEYALQLRLYLYTRHDIANENAANFLNYAISDEADSVISKAGFINLGIKSRVQSLEGDRARSLLDPDVDQFEGGVMREMMSAMVNYDRLSTTFRFNTGSSRMDERGLLDMSRLADYLETKPQGTKVMFVGFTDSVGAFASNRNLSQDRAGQVQQAVANFAGDRLSHIELTHTGFGEVAPSACNTSESGRAINRRVEVWIGKDARS